MDLKRLKLKEIKDKAKKYVDLCGLLYADFRTPRTAKIILWVATCYALSPVDLIPDYRHEIGYLDDVIILPALPHLVIKSVPGDVYTENYNQVFKK